MISNDDDLDCYCFFEQVSSLYMDPSIGNYIKVVIVKIILVEQIDAAPDLEVSSSADVTLASFCRWQHLLNPEDDNNPHHHDVAILVTRQDICSQHDAPCRYELSSIILLLLCIIRSRRTFSGRRVLKLHFQAECHLVYRLQYANVACFVHSDLRGQQHISISFLLNAETRSMAGAAVC